jgi:hypothetical protein
MLQTDWIAGKLLADSSIFITCAMTLAAFDISKATDAHGRIIEPPVDVTAGTVR